MPRYMQWVLQLKILKKEYIVSHRLYIGQKIMVTGQIQLRWFKTVCAVLHYQASIGIWGKDKDHTILKSNLAV